MAKNRHKCERCGKDIKYFYELNNKKLCTKCYVEDENRPKNILETTMSKQGYINQLEYEAQVIQLGWIWKYQYYIALAVAVFVISIIALILG